HYESEPDGRLRPRVFVRKVSVLATVRWLAAQPAVATMVFVAVLAGTASITLQTLAPRYVHAVLEVDAADAVYVFAPSAAGLGLALLATPRLVAARGERNTALFGFGLVSTNLACFGLVRDLEFIDPVNPLHALSLLGLDLSRQLRTAALLAVPLGFGLSLTATAVQTYLNRRVPLSHQGRTFALQSSLKNGVSVLPLITLGAASSAFGVENVLLASPLLLLAMAAALIRLSLHFAGHTPRGPLRELASYWEEPPAPFRPNPG
ncbi:MAG TPA: hypothetical protein VNN21_00030, partial [Dehalococcoidia bacterium]|nr:hypothetical protein [Dehalococcoidia bacterium]